MRLAKAVSIAVALAGAAVAPFVAHAQTSPVALPDTPADPIAVKRLEELLAVVNSGDAAAMRAYLQANSVDPRTNQGWSSLLLPLVLDLHRLSHGLDLVRVTTVGMQQIQPQLRGSTVGILRNQATGDEQALAIIVEPQAPHRITGLPILHPSLMCTEFGALKDTPYTIIVLSNLTIGTCVSVTGKIMRVLAPSKASAGATTGAPGAALLRGDACRQRRSGCSG